MDRFYLPEIKNGQFFLSEEESKHAVRVLRLQQGNTLELIDGTGGLYAAQIEDPNPKKTSFSILQKEQQESRSSFTLHLAIAPTKNIDRIEWLLEKATEMGIDEISLLLCRYSERKEVKLDRLDKILISAMKQCKSLYKPVLHPLIAFDQFIQQDFTGKKAIAHCMQGEKTTLSKLCNSSQNISVLIGPEGDFSSEELQKACAKGFEGVTLGDSRLRTETAALMAVAEVNLAFRS